jgi:hypothetical protein
MQRFLKFFKKNWDLSLRNEDEVLEYFAASGKYTVTLLGYSGRGYDHPKQIQSLAYRILKGYAPAETIVNIGATRGGIGRVYEVARHMGFHTTGIVSRLAIAEKARFSGAVDEIFVIPDDRWGGYLPGKKDLSPTSSLMVQVSEEMIAIGGGEITRDELEAGITAGKKYRYYRAKMARKSAENLAARSGLDPDTIAWGPVDAQYRELAEPYTL